MFPMVCVCRIAMVVGMLDMAGGVVMHVEMFVLCSVRKLVEMFIFFV